MDTMVMGCEEWTTCDFHYTTIMCACVCVCIYFGNVVTGSNLNVDYNKISLYTFYQGLIQRQFFLCQSFTILILKKLVLSAILGRICGYLALERILPELCQTLSNYYTFSFYIFITKCVLVCSFSIYTFI